MQQFPEWFYPAGMLCRAHDLKQPCESDPKREERLAAVRSAIVGCVEAHMTADGSGAGSAEVAYNVTLPFAISILEEQLLNAELRRRDLVLRTARTTDFPLRAVLLSRSPSSDKN